MQDLDVAFQGAFDREVRKTPEQRLEASLRASQEIARTRLGRTLDTFAHFYASVTALHFTERSVVVAQVGSCRAYRFRRQSLELLLFDHTLESLLAAEGTTLPLNGCFATTRPPSERASSSSDSPTSFPFFAHVGGLLAEAYPPHAG